MPRLFIEAGSPIRRSPAKLARQLTEAYRSLAASFIGFQRLGIHRAPVVALTTNPLPPQRGVVIPQVTLYSSVNVHPGLPAGWRASRRASPPNTRFGAGVHLEAVPLMELPAWCGPTRKHQTSFITRSTPLSRGGILPVPSLFPDRRFAGGAGGTRTPDFRLAKAALSQLSYGPTAVLWVVGDGGLEPPTSVLSGPRSNQLS